MKIKIEYIILIILGVAVGVAIALSSSSKGEVANVAIKDLKEIANPSQTQTVVEKTKNYPKYHEIEKPGGYVNTDGKPVKVADYIGKKVILLDFMTYSCINCQRTFPYLAQWYEKYEDKGLIIIGIHTPEFAFEHDINNVTKAMQEFGLKFPVVLDNDYGTWNAYGNNYWPRKYLIDIDGYVVYDHIGEGEYDKTEAKIVSLLDERAKKLGEADVTMIKGAEIKGDTEPSTFKDISPETYFGSKRNEYLGNGRKLFMGTGTQELTIPSTIKNNTLYLGGTWNFTDEYAESKTAQASIMYNYAAKNVYFVASSKEGVRVKILIDGNIIDKSMAGSDVDAEGYVNIKEDRLYNLIKGTDYKSHNLKMEIETSGLEAYTFTFG